MAPRFCLFLFVNSGLAQIVLKDKQQQPPKDPVENNLYLGAILQRKYSASLFEW